MDLAYMPWFKPSNFPCALPLSMPYMRRLQTLESLRRGLLQEGLGDERSQL